MSTSTNPFTSVARKQRRAVPAPKPFIACCDTYLNPRAVKIKKRRGTKTAIPACTCPVCGTVYHVMAIRP